MRGCSSLDNVGTCKATGCGDKHEAWTLDYLRGYITVRKFLVKMRWRRPCYKDGQGQLLSDLLCDGISLQ